MHQIFDVPLVTTCLFSGPALSVTHQRETWDPVSSPSKFPIPDLGAWRCATLYAFHCSAIHLRPPTIKASGNLRFNLQDY